MIKCLQALLLGFALFAGAAQAQAQPQSRTAVAEVAAALSLAQAGVTTQNAPLILTGLEILTHHAPAGPAADAVFATFAAEAQFLLRGDAKLKDRLQSLHGQRATPAQPARILIFDAAQELRVPEGTEIRSVAVTRGALLNSLADSRGQSCTRRAQLWHCGFVPADGVLIATGPVTGPAWMVANTPAPRP